MHISEAGLRLIEGFEGFSSRRYWDSYGRVWTRGFGETEGITADSPSITRAQGQANLKRRIERFYEPAIDALRLPLTQDMFDALCSLTWNLGVGVLGEGYSIGRALHAHQWFAAANAMLEYDHAGGVVLQGLKTRREAERRLFLSASPKAAYVPADEARWLREWDHLGRTHVTRRRVLRRTLRAREQAIETAAVHQRNGWKVLNRRARAASIHHRVG